MARDERRARALAAQLLVLLLLLPLVQPSERSTYGDIRTLGYFYTDVKLGTPPQTFSVIIDTGSSMTVIPCAGCLNCGTHDLGNPLFDATQSSTGAAGAGAPVPFHKHYMEGSSLDGVILADRACIGATCEVSDAFAAQFGCARTMTNLFRTQSADGIMGMGMTADAASGARSIVQSMAAARGADHAAFALCFGREGGFVTAGGWSTAHHVAPLRWAHLTTISKASPFYRVHVATAGLGDPTADHAVGGPVMIDTGSSYSYAPAATFDALSASLRAWCGADTATRCRATAMPSRDGALACFDFGADAAASVATFPPLRFTLRAADASDAPVELCIPPAQYFYVDEPASQQLTSGCVGLVKDALWTIGANLLMDFDVVFDLTPPHGVGSGRERAGFARAKCGSDRKPWQCKSERTVVDLAAALSAPSSLSFSEGPPLGVIRRLNVGRRSLEGAGAGAAAAARRRRRRY